jgi:hypothetical protein
MMAQSSDEGVPIRPLSRDNGKPAAAHWPQYGEVPTVERRDRPRLIAIG